MSDDSINKIENVKRHLYDPDNPNVNRPREGVLHTVKHSAPLTWQESSKSNETLEKINMPPTSIFKKFFIAAILFFIAALGFAGYMYLSGGTSVSSDNIDIIVIGNAFTKGGDELPLQVEIINRNNADLELANLVIEYPRGANDDPNDIVRLPRDSIGTIKSGTTITRNIKVKLFGGEKLVRNVRIRLEYHPESSNAIFTKDKEYPVTISSAPLTLAIEAPSTISTNQSVTLSIKASLNTSLPSAGAALQVSYPNNFIFESATPKPLIGNSLWDISSLTVENPQTITVKGRLSGQVGDQQAFHVYAGMASPKDPSVVDVVYNSLLHIIDVTKPFLEARILVNNEDLENYAVSGGEGVSAEIVWANNLPYRITDAQIIARFSGNAFDRNALTSGGFFDSANSQIVWDKNTVNELTSIEPGARGSVQFRFTPLSLLLSGQRLKSPQVVVDVSIKGRQTSEGISLSDVNDFVQKTFKLVSDLQIAASATYNSGAFPPKAESETKYTVTWTLSNSSNTVTGGEARTSLPIYVNWVGSVAGNENISYNSITREVIWKIGTVNPNTGFDSNREASFTVSLNPSISQVGSVPQLIREITLSGQDSFANIPIKKTRPALTTRIINDPLFKTGYDRVTD